MRLIKLALRNVLIVTAVLVLFTNFSSARTDADLIKKADKIAAKCSGKETGANCLLVMACVESKHALTTLKKSEADEVAKNLVGGEALAKKGEKEGGVAITDNTCGYSAFTAQSTAKLTGESELFAHKCSTACSQTPVEDKQAEAANTDISASQAKNMLEELREDLCSQFKMYATSYSQGMSSNVATCMAAKKAKGSLLTKVAIGGAAIGGGLLLMDHIGDKKEKKKEKKAEEEKKRAENGIIKDADGNDLQCFSEQNFMRTECFETMLGLCQAGKSTTAGCKAFNSNYCASSGSGTNYCLYADSKNYCSQAGSAIASSPACAWSNSRSAECKKNPEQVSCLYSGSADSLTLACASYPNDPLCISHAAGRIVVQGGTTESATELAATDGDGASITMSSVIDSNATTSDNSASDTLASTESIFSNSSSVAQKACADGLLQNCGN